MSTDGGLFTTKNTKNTKAEWGGVARESARMIANDRLAKISVN
jgi:hypothetical protein